MRVHFITRRVARQCRRAAFFATPAAAQENPNTARRRQQCADPDHRRRPAATRRSSLPRGVVASGFSTSRLQSPLIRASSSTGQGALDITDIADTTPNVTLEVSPRHQQHADPVHPRHRPAGSCRRLRAGRRPLSRRRLPEPPAGGGARHLRCRAHRGAARPAGHALRPQHDRRRDQICDPQHPDRRPARQPSHQSRHATARPISSPRHRRPLTRRSVGAAVARLSSNGFGKNLTTARTITTRTCGRRAERVEFQPADSVFFRLSGDYTLDNSNPRGGHRLINNSYVGRRSRLLRATFSTAKAGSTTPSKRALGRCCPPRRDRPQRLAEVPAHHRLSQGPTAQPRSTSTQRPLPMSTFRPSTRTTSSARNSRWSRTRGRCRALLGALLSQCQGRTTSSTSGYTTAAARRASPLRPSAMSVPRPGPSLSDCDL